MKEKELIDYKKIDKLSTDVLNVSKNTLLAYLRFLDVALNQFRYMPVDKGTIKTNGRFFIYNPKYILSCYKEEKERPVRDYLHIVLHCVFSHMYAAEKMDQPIWDLACDMAVEYAILELNLEPLAANREKEQRKLLRLVENEIGKGNLTAEKIYRYFLDQEITANKAADIRSYFEADEHDIWYQTEKDIKVLEGDVEKEKAIKNPDLGFEPDFEPKESESDENSFNPKEGSGDKEKDREPDLSPNGKDEENWKKISKRMQVELETMQAKRAASSGNLMQNLISANKERYDYSAFLKKFAVRKEIMKLNDEEFDYVYYTYGLKLYSAMPLIEPLEYKEVKKIKEFVIAIDVSYSVSGELVEKFLEKTYNILKSTESFFSKINLHIILCDAQIKKHVKITDQKEFDEFFKELTINGLGGTDFRPVFALMEELIGAGEFKNLKGLIYFTDGDGVFPNKKPQYETAFVFTENADDVKVPGWAMKIVLSGEDF